MSLSRAEGSRLAEGDPGSWLGVDAEHGSGTVGALRFGFLKAEAE
jgi:hypothetical protein